jgi:iron uptake system EfeUOB component EfeO/EfeM
LLNAMFTSAHQRRALWVAVSALTALCAFLLLTTLGVDSHSHPVQSKTATYIPLANYTERAPHVLSALAITGVQGEVSGASDTPPSELSPLPPSSFEAPEAEYRSYAIRQIALMEGQITRLTHSLAANERASAQAAWRSAYSSYMRLGAVYLTGQVATLNQKINGNAQGLEGGTASPEFSGLHRIEDGLWGTAQPRTLLGSARQLNVDVHKLRNLLPSVSITPLEYATRAHEVLEDAVRDLLSGTDVPLSGEGVLAADAGLSATKEVFQTLRPLLEGRENVSLIVPRELAALQRTMSSLAEQHGGRLPSNGALTQQQSELLNSSMGAALEALAQVPGALESEPTPQIPSIPKRDEEIDP